MTPEAVAEHVVDLETKLASIFLSQYPVAYFLTVDLIHVAGRPLTCLPPVPLVEYAPARPCTILI